IPARVICLSSRFSILHALIAMAIKACNMEKREDRQMTLAGIILMGVIAAIPGWFLYEIFSHAP
ncbi:hypothetical protein, partial [Salmonella enterica]|uniref:hypothetical protein n=1 Tax=Salmonella enterica TaxID=28901 RepID=UPI00398C5DAB